MSNEMKDYLADRPKMKIVAVGDIHGKTVWRKIFDAEPCDRFIFIGDYFDNYENTPTRDQVDNFNAIVALKREFPSKVVLLVGNHDYHYMAGVDSSERYSGYQRHGAIDIQEAIEAARRQGALQMAYQEGDIVFTHAGVTKTWFSAYSKLDVTEPVDGVADAINEVFATRLDAFEFCGQDQYGDSITQSPIWVRPRSLVADRIPHRLVVGHTQVQAVQTYEGVTLIDCLDADQCLVIEDGEFSIGKF